MVIVDDTIAAFTKLLNSTPGKKEYMTLQIENLVYLVDYIRKSKFSDVF